MSFDLFSFAGKRIVVTGGASGVGAALIRLLDTLGRPEVTVLDVQEPTGLSASQRWLSTDLGDQAALAASIGRLGAVDVLFNNAAVAGTAAPAKVFAVNVLALRHLTESVTAQMAPGGVVVNTSSTAGGRWNDRLAPINEVLDIEDWDKALSWFEENHATLGVDPYSFSKECVQVLTLRKASALGEKGLRMNSVCPSPIDTPLLKDFRASWSDKVIDFTIGAAGGLATPEEIAQVLAFLAMDASSQVNGVNLLADGGSSAGFLTGTIDTSALRS